MVWIKRVGWRHRHWLYGNHYVELNTDLDSLLNKNEELPHLKCLRRPNLKCETKFLVQKNCKCFITNKKYFTLSACFIVQFISYSQNQSHTHNRNQQHFGIGKKNFKLNSLCSICHFFIAKRKKKDLTFSLIWGLNSYLAAFIDFFLSVK